MWCCELNFYRPVKVAKEAKEESLAASPRRTLSPDLLALDFNSLLEESTDSWRAESRPTAALALLQQSTLLPSLSTWLLRSSNSQATPARISRPRELLPVTCSLLSAETRSSTLSLRPPLLVVVLFLTSTRLSLLRANECETAFIWSALYLKLTQLTFQANKKQYYSRKYEALLSL